MGGNLQEGKKLTKDLKWLIPGISQQLEVMGILVLS